jgi:hypothetical protein
MLAKLRPQLLVNVVRVECHAFRESQRDLLLLGEVRSRLVVACVLDLIFCIAVALCQSAMGL